MESKEEALERMIDPAKTEIDRKQRKGARMCAFWMTMGFALTGLVLNFWYVQYILPVIGMTFFCIGIRGMRKVNPFFKAAWILVLIRMGIQIVSLMVLALPVSSFAESTVINWIGVAILLAFYWLLHCAWKDVFEKAGQDIKHKPYLLALIWMVLVTLLAVTPIANTWVGFIVVFVFYLVILRQMECMENDLAGIDPVNFSKVSGNTGKEK